MIPAALQEATHLQDTGALTEAEQFLRRQLLQLDTFCPTEPLDLLLTQLGHVLQLNGRHAEAEREYRRALEIRVARYGAESPGAAMSSADIATALASTGRTDEAETLLRQSSDVVARTLGEDHVDTLTIRNNLASVMILNGQFARAQPVLRSVVAGFERLKTGRPRFLVIGYRNLAVVHYAQAEFEESARYTAKQIEVAESIADQAGIAEGLSNLIVVRLKQHRWDEAEALLPRALLLANGRFPATYGNLLISRAEIRRHRKGYAEAEADLTSAIVLFEQGGFYRRMNLCAALHELAALLREQNRKVEAKRVEERRRQLLSELGIRDPKSLSR